RFAPFRDGVPSAVLGKPTDWTVLDDVPLGADDESAWTRRGRAIVARNGADRWSTCEVGEDRWSCCVVHATVTMTQATPVEIRFGLENQVVLAGNGTFLYRHDEPIAADSTVRLAKTSGPLELVVARRERRIEVWVNGRKALSTDLGTCDPAKLGLAIHRGAAAFDDVRVRRFR